MLLNSAKGVLALLDEPNVELKTAALMKLNVLVDSFWAEIAGSITAIEMLYEDREFKNRELAALIAAKVYFHLGEYDFALEYALAASSRFDTSEPSEFVECMLAKCVDTYAKQRVGATGDSRHLKANAVPTTLNNSDANSNEQTPRSAQIDQKALETVVTSMFERCLEAAQFRSAVGLAVETRRLDWLVRTLDSARVHDAAPARVNATGNSPLGTSGSHARDGRDVLEYTQRIALNLLDRDRQFRQSILEQLVIKYLSLAKPDLIQVSHCLIYLDDAKRAAHILDALLRNGLSLPRTTTAGAETETAEPVNAQALASVAEGDAVLMAYQISVDLYENATQQFVDSLLEELDALAALSNVPVAGNTTSTISGATASRPAEGVADKSENEASEKTTSASASESSAGQNEAASRDRQSYSLRTSRVRTILSGSKTIEVALQFLIRQNRADALVMRTLKENTRNSVHHCAAIVANGFMQLGTTSDQFLRENLEWLARATNWARFTATASLGVIHRGHEKDALRLMAAYLPKEASGTGSAGGSAYSDGGGLYALGLLHANHGRAVTEYLLEQLRAAGSEPVRHGACLALGLAAMATARSDVYEALKTALYQDEAVVGEAAALAIGLVMLGTHNAQALGDLLAYARDTQHEKILRGVAVALALLVYGRLGEADALISELVRDKDPILRWAGVYAIAMAYRGAANNSQLRTLLHLAVSDVHDDVRRAAVISIGFLLIRAPEQCPLVVALLAESYNPHVRYGAALALGVACAGSGYRDALALLDALYHDPVAFVRQGALLAGALIMVGHNATTCPRSTAFREHVLKVVADKHEDLLTKFGAMLAAGILDAGGRNATIALATRSGHVRMPAVVGMLVFQQFWFWYPLGHFLSLCFTPTCLVLLNEQLDMPRVPVRSAARPSTFAYPPPLTEKTKEAKEKFETAVLSITAKQKRKDEEKKLRSGAAPRSSTSVPLTGATSGSSTAPASTAQSRTSTDKMEVDPTSTSTEGTVQSHPGATEKEKKPEEKKAEPTFETLENPCRVMLAQLSVLQLPEDSRYVPLKDLSNGGVIMVRDKRPHEQVELVEQVKALGPLAAEDEGPEPEPPEPFEFIDA